MNRSKQIIEAMGESQETLYADYIGGRWEMWVHVEGGKHAVGVKTVRMLLKDKAKLVVASPHKPSEFLDWLKTQ